VVPDWRNPQAWNAYSYCLNNPLRYNDPTGNWPHIHWGKVLKVIAAVAVVTAVAVVAAPVVLPALSTALSMALVGGGSITIGGATTAAVAAYSAAAAIGATMAVAPIVSSIDEPLFQSNDSAASSGLNAAGGYVASTPPEGPWMNRSEARNAASQMGLNKAQEGTVKRAIKEATSKNTINISRSGENVIVKVYRPGRNGYQIIEHNVQPSGIRDVVQKAYDEAGNLVHYHPK
jgi:hypothetical protein